MKYGTLILAAALVAAVPPPPPPTLAPSTPQTSPAPATSATPESSTTPAADSSAMQSPLPSSSSLPNIDIFGNEKKSTPKPKGSPTPPPSDRKGLDGVWEVAIQPIGADATYEHLLLKQTGQALAGSYLTKDKKRYPLAGALDGTQIRLVVTLSDGSTMILEGKVDGTTDMVGMLTNAKGQTPFTAAYRPKEKWMDNINASPGGMGGGGIPPR